MKRRTKRRSYKISWTIAAMVAVITIPFIWWLYVSIDDDMPEIPEIEEEIFFPPPILRFGFDTANVFISDETVERGQTLGGIFLKNGFGHGFIHQILTASEDVFDARLIREGDNYHFIRPYNSPDSLPSHLVYEKNPLVYFVFQLTDSLHVQRWERPTYWKIDTATAVVESSLYEALRGKGVPVTIIMKLADMYGWAIDFFRIQKGDYIKMMYEVQVVDDSVVVGYGRIPGALFYHGGKEWYGFYFRSEDGSYSGYFDDHGKAMKKTFLKAPLDFFRISSRYNPKRLHPVLKTMRPHLGTDYAAPTGTPIRTTADGTIEKMGYTSGNGNYIKVRHNSTYSTQYLHMSKFADGMKQGRAVKQGDIIGFVGSTGLATGPHVCYRFWKNGVQVDPLKEELPSAEPIEEVHRENFEEQMRVFKEALDKLSL